MIFKSSSASNTQPARGNTGTVDTLIGRHTEILGDVRFTGGLHVDGRIKGKVISNTDKGAALSVSENGVIEGDVRVPSIVLNGSVTGDVYAAEKITLAPKARVSGNVFYKILEIQAGAQVNGQLVHETRDPLAALTHQPGEVDFVSDPKVIDVRDMRKIAASTP